MSETNEDAMDRFIEVLKKDADKSEWYEFLLWFIKAARSGEFDICDSVEETDDEHPMSDNNSEVDEAYDLLELTEDAVMAVIKASRPSFRNSFDSIAFAVHASFLSSGYTLLATGIQAFKCDYSPPPSDDEVGIEGWNELEEQYEFVYLKLENNLKKIVYVTCLVIGDDLAINALWFREGGNIIQNVQINVKDYTEENSWSSNLADKYKNFGKLVKTLNSDLLSRMEDSPKKEESLKKDAGTPSSDAHVVYHDPARTEQKELEHGGTDL